MRPQQDGHPHQLLHHVDDPVVIARRFHPAGLVEPGLSWKQSILGLDRRIFSHVFGAGCLRNEAKASEPFVDSALPPAHAADTQLDILGERAFLHHAIDGRSTEAGPIHDGLESENAIVVVNLHRYRLRNIQAPGAARGGCLCAKRQQLTRDGFGPWGRPTANLVWCVA